MPINAILENERARSKRECGRASKRSEYGRTNHEKFTSVLTSRACETSAFKFHLKIILLYQVMKSQNQVLLESLEEYYKEYPKNLEYLIKVVQEKGKVSLRVLDWFVTNYSQNNGIVIDESFDVYENYKVKLASYRKRRFDPFCRKFKINYYINDHKIETSCGQLLFFKWCFQNNIIKYVEDHIQTIENDMKDNTPKKRTNKTIVSYKTIKKSSNIKHTITFQ